MEFWGQGVMVSGCHGVTVSRDQEERGGWYNVTHVLISKLYHRESSRSLAKQYIRFLRLLPLLHHLYITLASSVIPPRLNHPPKRIQPLPTPFSFQTSILLFLRRHRAQVERTVFQSIRGKRGWLGEATTERDHTRGNVWVGAVGRRD